MLCLVLRFFISLFIFLCRCCRPTGNHPETTGLCLLFSCLVFDGTCPVSFYIVYRASSCLVFFSLTVLYYLFYLSFWSFLVLLCVVPCLVLLSRVQVWWQSTALGKRPSAADVDTRLTSRCRKTSSVTTCLLHQDKTRGLRDRKRHREQRRQTKTCGLNCSRPRLPTHFFPKPPCYHHLQVLCWVVIVIIIFIVITIVLVSAQCLIFVLSSLPL